MSITQALIAIQQKHNVTFPVKAGKEHKRIILAAKGDKLKVLPKEPLEQLITTVIFKAKAYTGQGGFDEDVIEGAIEVLVNRIRRGEYPTLTAEQLQLIIERGTSGDYGEFFGINSTSIQTWIREYQNREEKYKKEQAQHEAKQKFEMEAAIRAEYYKDNETKLMLKRFEAEYDKKVKDPLYVVQDSRAMFYKYLIEHERLPRVNPEKAKWTAIAKQMLKDKWSKRLTELDTPKPVKEQIKRSIENIDNALEDRDNYREFRYTVAGLILNNYLLHHTQMNSKFQDII